MNCREVQQYLSEYWDLSSTDQMRLTIEQHLSECSVCREEFEIWRQSRSLIHDIGSMTNKQPSGLQSIAHTVMDRIYADERWRIPVAARAYNLTYKVRLNAMIVMMLLLSLFVVSLFMSITKDDPNMMQQLDGIFPVANAASDHGSSIIHAGMFEGIPVASISSPTILTIGPIQSYPDYLLAVSLLGIIFTILLLNWFNRIRA